MDLNEVLVFTRVVQAGSFTAAGRMLGMPKSSVSKKVSDLENRIGARLLQRTTRKLGLTDAGRIFFERCERIVSELEEAEQAVHQLQASPRGLLRVTAPLSFGMLGPMIGAFLEAHPDVQLELTCTDRLVDLVEEGFDVAIRAGRLEDSSLVARRLGTMKRVLVASPGYLRRRGTPRTVEELAQHDCLAFGAGTSQAVWTLQSGDARHDVRPSARLTVNDYELMLEVALAGQGIALMPEPICGRSIRERKLRQVLPKWGTPPTPIHAVYPTARHLSPKVVAFVKVLREQFAALQPQEPRDEDA